LYSILRPGSINRLIVNNPSLINSPTWVEFKSRVLLNTELNTQLYDQCRLHLLTA